MDRKNSISQDFDDVSRCLAENQWAIVLTVRDVNSQVIFEQTIDKSDKNQRGTTV